jgi:hypothetical protein
MPTESILRGAMNTTAKQVAPCEPWNFVIKAPAEVMTDKNRFSAWRSKPTSEHLVFTASEGLNAGLRCNKTNPLRRLHGIIADFDALVTDNELATLFDRCPADLRPTWVSRTFSTGARLVWMFEEPIALEVGEMAKEFMRVAYRELRIEKIFAGADEPAFTDLYKLYDVGREWKKLGDYKLSTNLIHYWMVEASKKTKWAEHKEINIPIEAVAEEVEKVFPGRWEGEFEVGRRGVVFFDPNATNNTAAIVTEAGMICFSSEQLFWPWSKIFGGSFIRQFQQDKIGGAVSHVWHDGKAYYRRSLNSGAWESMTKEDFGIHLKVAHGIDAGKERGACASELEQALEYVHTRRRVAGLIPQVYCPDEIINSNGQRYLNCAVVKPLLAVDVPQTWGENFPFLANFFDTCFDPAPVPAVVLAGQKPKRSMDAKTIFLAWLQRAYASGVAGKLLKGQAMVLAGGVGKGKTLLSVRMVGALLGGFSDASHYLLSASNFNKEMLEQPLWTIDDGVAANDPQAALRFSETIKSAVANPFFTYRAMYKDGLKVGWDGRVLITCNDDVSSIRIIPNLDDSIIDKIIVLSFAEGVREFPPNVEEVIARELPYFARWLLDWQPPAEITGATRFGINSYIHEGLRVKALHAGGVSDVMELIDLWKKRMKPQEKHGEQWKDTASAWLAEAGTDPALYPLVSKFTARSLGRKFMEASRIRGSGISVAAEGTKHGNVYCIDLTGDVHTKTITVTV